MGNARDAGRWEGRFEIAADAVGLAVIVLECGDWSSVRTLADGCSLLLDDGSRVPLQLEGTCLLGFTEEHERGAWCDLEERWGALFGVNAPSPLARVTLRARRVPDGARVAVRGHPKWGWKEEGYRDPACRVLEEIEASAIEDLTVVDEALPEPAPVRSPDPTAGWTFGRAILLGLATAYVLVAGLFAVAWALRPSSEIAAMSFCIVVPSLAAYALVFAISGIGLRSRADRCQDDWLPTFVEQDKRVGPKWKTRAASNAQVMCGVLSFAALLYVSLLVIANLEDPHYDSHARLATGNAASPLAVFSAIDEVRVAACVLAFGAVGLLLACWWWRQDNARRLRSLLLARVDAKAGGWALVVGTVIQSIDLDPPYHHLSESDEDETGQSGDFLLDTGDEKIVVGGQATWATRFLRRGEMGGSRHEYAFARIRDIPVGARVIAAGRVDRTANDRPIMRSHGPETLVLFAADERGPTVAGLRRRLRVHDAHLWLAAAYLLGGVVLLWGAIG